jgi:hypothetical protein
MNTTQVVELAAKHLLTPCAMQSSAELCYSDAVRMLANGELIAARRWALKSLDYSIGILHPDHRLAVGGA